jgi:sulfotransferase family protein
VLPNLVVIGARKCGTTSLHRYLSVHPEIWMSTQKELGLFRVNRGDWRSRIDWYKAQFPVPAAVRGESTPGYSAYPLGPDVPARMQETIPTARLIYLVGDPLRRITAQWVHWYAYGYDREPKYLSARNADQPLADILRSWSDPRNAYVAPSRYATQLERYLRHFPQERILLVDQSELKRRRKDTLTNVFRFLGVDPEFESPEFSAELNPGAHKRRQLSSYWRLRRGLLQAGGSRIPASIRQPIGSRLGRVLSRPVARPEIRDQFPAGLVELLHEETDRLRALTGQSFESWSV